MAGADLELVQAHEVDDRHAALPGERGFFHRHFLVATVAGPQGEVLKGDWGT